MVSNLALVFLKPPQGAPILNKHITIEKRTFDPISTPLQDGIIVKNLYLSLDPYIRGCMRDPDDATWCPAFAPGQPIICGAVSRVLVSKVPDFQTGDIVWGMFGAEEYSIVPDFMLPWVRKIFNPYGLDLSLFTGALGVAGLSAYASLYEYGKPAKGQTIFISAASGGVGQIVGQLAKMEGMRVIGSVGSDEKLGFILTELGYDTGFNYKTESVENALSRLAPEGIDIYYDNVGGETLDTALMHMRDFGRIVSCGMISQYNLPQQERYGLKNGMEIFLRRLSINGFIISDPYLPEKYALEFFEKMSKWLKEGDVKTKQSITVGIDRAAKAYLGMFSGENFGKTVIKVNGDDGA